MRVYPYTSVPAETYPGSQGVGIRWAIGENVGAPNFVLRVIELDKGAATAYHQHDWEHEVFVLAGTGQVRDANGTQSLETGTCVYVAPSELHQFANQGETQLRFICVIPNPKR